MSDIFHEVEQDLRREQLRRLWDRYGLLLIAAAVLIVALTAGWRGYVAWQASTARDGGDRFFAALGPATGSEPAVVSEAMKSFAADAPAGYRLLARFRAASELARSGDPAAAVKEFDAIAADAAVPSLYRELADVRAAYLLVDVGDRAGAESRAAPIAAGRGPWRQAAREALGLAAYGAGDQAAARQQFQSIIDDQSGSAEFANRARMMLALMRAEAPPADAAAAPGSGGGQGAAAADGPVAPAATEAPEGEAQPFELPFTADPAPAPTAPTAPAPAEAAPRATAPGEAAPVVPAAPESAAPATAPKEAAP